jgi:hypothetical protein
MKWLTILGLALTVLALPVQAAAESVWDPKPGGAAQPPVEMTVYRSPTCGCCGQWLEHMTKHGFVITDIKTDGMDAIKKKYGVPENLQSCHTALVDGYVIEGHVPAADVRALLQKRPQAAGLTVPGMPSGTPGMEMGGRKDPFAVLEFDKKGSAKTFHEYGAY